MLAPSNSHRPKATELAGSPGSFTEAGQCIERITTPRHHQSLRVKFLPRLSDKCKIHSLALMLALPALAYTMHAAPLTQVGIRGETDWPKTAEANIPGSVQA